MKLNVIAIALTTILFSCSQNKNTQNVTLEDEIDSTSFAIGVSVGENLNNQFDEYNSSNTYQLSAKEVAKFINKFKVLDSFIE